MNLRLLITRHGQTDWNNQGLFQGQTDIPLNATGCKQAYSLGKRLSVERIDKIYASDLARAWQTAQAVAAHQKCEPIPDVRLREMSFGDWEGMTYNQIVENHPRILANWHSDILHTSTPNGETLHQLDQRVCEFISILNNNDSDECVLIVSHGGPLQVLLCQTLGLRAEFYWQFHLSHTSLSEISMYASGSILKLFNDTCHLMEIS